MGGDRSHASRPYATVRPPYANRMSLRARMLTQCHRHDLERGWPRTPRWPETRVLTAINAVLVKRRPTAYAGLERLCATAPPTAVRSVDRQCDPRCRLGRLAHPRVVH